ncbi:unnamed protein product [Paramecium octaurelia]|uniref:Uncharacterized protein n=1 Tax=Paramecium octaurelia TaxID=43137 RepID=A0A8S1XTW4_PAROT|nr:unnamed protein product [Paramecium octaurelia]
MCQHQTYTLCLTKAITKSDKKDYQLFRIYFMHKFKIFEIELNLMMDTLLTNKIQIIDKKETYSKINIIQYQEQTNLTNELIIQTEKKSILLIITIGYKLRKKKNCLRRSSDSDQVKCLAIQKRGPHNRKYLTQINSWIHKQKLYNRNFQIQYCFQSQDDLSTF